MTSINKLDLLSNEPIQFQNRLQIYKPTLAQIVKMGYENFSRASKILTLTDTQIQDQLESQGIFNQTYSPLSYLLLISKNALFFLEVQLAFTTYIQKPVILNFEKNFIEIPFEKEDSFILDEANFPDFQHILNLILGNTQEIEREIISENEKMKRKFLEKRKMLQRAKEKERLRDSGKEKGLDLADMVSAVCTYGVGYNYTNVWDLTIYQLHEQFVRCQKKDKFEHDYQALLQGADKKKVHIKDWIK